MVASDSSSDARAASPGAAAAAVDLPHPTVLPAPAAESPLGTAGGDLAPWGLRGPGRPLFEHTACADPAWHFALALPDGAELVPQPSVAPTFDEPTQSLGLFRTTAPAADIEVIGHVLEYEIDPHDWLERALRADGREIASSRPQPLLSGVAGDVVATWSLDDEAFAGRFLATKWGPRLFVVCGRTRRADYAACAEELFRAAASFEALDASLGAFAEHVHTVDQDEPVHWSVAVPDSWSIRTHPSSAEGAWFEALHSAPSPADEQAGEVDGRLSFAVMARSVALRPRDAGNVLLRALRDNDVTVEHAAFERDDALLAVCRSACGHAWSLATPVRRAAARGELRCRVMMHAEAWIVAGVLGPTREENDDAWMRNKRVLDLTCTTLELRPQGRPGG